MSSFTITLDSADPTWNRSNYGGAGSYPYETVDVYISSPLCYAITGTGGTHPDAYLYVYNQGDFDVTDPNAPVGSNLVMRDDDDGDGLLPAMSGMLGDPSLTPGMYTIVVTSFSSSDDRKYGSLDFSIFGANLGGYCHDDHRLFHRPRRRIRRPPSPPRPPRATSSSCPG